MDRLQKRLNFGNDVVENIYSMIAEIDSVKISWNFITQSSQLPKYLVQSVIVTSTGSSNRIEGNLLSDEEVEKIYKNPSDIKIQSRDEIDVLGYSKALEIIFENYETIELKESNILHLHKIMMGGSLEYGGFYKKSDNRVEAKNEKGEVINVIFEPTPAFLVENEMRDLIDWYFYSLGKKHPLILIANFIFEFLAIHPFTDGNGRMSRLLTNLLLLQNGYLFTKASSHEKIIEKRKSDYYKALNDTQRSWKKEHENIYPWLKFFLEAIGEQKSLAILMK